MNKGIFITGTDTGVGKTFVAAGLIRAMKEAGLSVCPMKPAESGCRTRKGRLVPADAMKLIKASGLKEPDELINPYRLKHPLAPAVAADIENVNISRKKILTACRRLSKKYDMTVVEGAGGIMVPVCKKYLFIDLAEDLGFPVLIVSRPGLGTINHTLLTIEVLKNRGLYISGVVINYGESSKKGLSEKTNPGVIEKLGRVPVLGAVPYLTGSNKHYIESVFREIAAGVLR